MKPYEYISAFMFLLLWTAIFATKHRITEKGKESAALKSRIEALEKREAILMNCIENNTTSIRTITNIIESRK